MYQQRWALGCWFIHLSQWRLTHFTDLNGFNFMSFPSVILAQIKSEHTSIDKASNKRLHLFEEKACCLLSCYDNINVATPGWVGNVCQPDCVSALQLPWQPVKPFMCTATWSVPNESEKRQSWRRVRVCEGMTLLHKAWTHTISYVQSPGV